MLFMETGLGALEQVGYIKIVSPLLHVGEVKRIALYLEHAQHVGPAIPSRSNASTTGRVAATRSEGVRGLCASDRRVRGGPDPLRSRGPRISAVAPVR